jgi:hypothetical protein
MKLPRILRFTFIGIAILLVGAAAMYFGSPRYDSSKVHPIVRDVHLPLKRLELTPFPNGFLIEFVSSDDKIGSALLEFWNTPAIGHKLQVKIEPEGKSERVEGAYSETSLALAALVNQYAKPGKNRDEVLYWLTDGNKYRVIGAVRRMTGT